MADQEATPVAMPDISNDAARDAWLNGKPLSAEKTEDAAPSEPAEQAASTDAIDKPASETGDPAPSKGKGVKARNAELDAEIAALNEKLRIRKEVQRQLDATPERAQPKPDAKTDSSPAVDKKADAARYRAMPDAPKVDHYETYEDWATDMAVFVADKRHEEREATASEQRRQQQDEQRLDAKWKAAGESAAEYIKANPEVVKSIDPALQAITPISRLTQAEIAELQKPEHAELLGDAFIAEEVFDSGVPVQLMAYFSTDEGAQKWVDLRRAGPEAIVRGIAKLAAKYESGAAPPSSTRPPKTISTSPDPAETLGKRPGTIADPVESALFSGDPSAYQDEMNRRDWARQNP